MRQLVYASCLVALLVGCDDGQGQYIPEVTLPEDPISGFAGPLEAVEVKVDDLGLSHVYARNDLDLFYTSGYLQGRDVLFALDVLRRRSVGTLAELRGEAGLDADIQARALGFEQLGEASVALLAREAPREHNLLVAFCAGLNARVEEIRAGQAALPDDYVALGLSPARFTPAELMAIGVRIQFGYSSTLEYDLLNTLVRVLSPEAAQLPLYQPASQAFILRRGAPVASAPPQEGAQKPQRPRLAVDPAQLPALVEGLRRWRRLLDVGDGSNVWAIHAEHSANGRSMLANDSHGSYTAPSLLYLSHLNSADAGGSFDMLGMGFLGVPGVHLGHNRRVAWGATTNFADLTDLWEVPVEDGVARLGGQEVPVSQREEVIRVRQEDGGMRQEVITARWIEGVGVLLPDALLPVPRTLFAQGELLLGWPGFQANDELLMFLALDRSQDLYDFHDSIALGKTGMQNWTAASADQIAYRAHGLVPDRGPLGRRIQANVILDGTDPDQLWSGRFLPPEQLPAAFGGDYLSSANNDPWGHSADNDPLNDSFYYGSFFAPGFRAARLQEALDALVARGGVTVEDSQRLQLEVRSQLSGRVLPLLAGAVEALERDEALAPWRPRAQELREALAALEAWDGRATLESREALLFRLCFAWLSRRLLADDLSLLFDAVDDAQPVTIIKLTLLTLEQDLEAFHEGQPQVALVGALADALDTLAQRPELRTWGDLRYARFRTPTDDFVDYRVPGEDTSLNVAQVSCWEGGRIAEFCTTDVGAVYRYVVSFDEQGTPQMHFQWPEGNALDTQDWLQGEGGYRVLPFLREDVEARQVRSWTLEPGR